MSEPGVVARPRVLQRLSDAATHRILLIVAAAGCGKTIALDAYAATLGRGCVRFDVGPEHRTLDAFVRGLTDAFSPAHRICETVIVDGVQVVQDDAAITGFLLGLISRTKANVRWILASRATVGLPVGTWLAHGDCNLVIDAADLRLTIEEARDAARDLGFAVEDDQLAGVLEFTEGWPAATNVALRACMRSVDAPKLHGIVREASRRFWKEQVYPGVDAGERDVLAVAAVLPEIDVRILQSAGFANARRAIETFGAKTGLIEEVSGSLYRCRPQLFADFLRHQTELLPAPEHQVVYARAARALESHGNIECALDGYVAAGSQADVLRLLESAGFDLLERGRGDVASRAIDSLKETTRRSSPRILALRGVLQSLAGNPVRAEALLRRSLSRAQGDRDLVASATMRLALLLTNQGDDIAELLIPLADDSEQSATNRAEAWSLLAAQRALSGHADTAKNAMERVAELIIDIDLESVRAKVLQRIGVAAMYIGESERARESLSQAAGLATELRLYNLASRAYANLSNLMLHRFDDVPWQLWYAEQASIAAIKAGNAFDIETATLQLLYAELRCGRSERSAALEDQLTEMRVGDQSRTHYLTPSKALRLAWEGRFSEAHRMLAPCWNRLHHDFDRAVCGAHCALFFAIDGKRQVSITLTKRVVEVIAGIETEGPYSVRSIAMAHLCCGIAEAINGRSTHADRIVRRVATNADDEVVALMATIADELIIHTSRRSRRESDVLAQALGRLASLGYTHISLLFESVRKVLEARKPEAETGGLTPVERVVLRFLAEGLSPKEIAARRGCSVHTIRAHTANSIAKLRCNGRSEAIALGRRMGILD
jgi:ATP/maltotriose-dependent transcriptional regulator MalT